MKLRALLVTSLCLLSTSANANHPWGTYHWATNRTPTAANPVTLKIGDNLKTTEWSAYLTTTINDWNNPGSAPAGSFDPKASTTPFKATKVTGTAGTSCSAITGTTQVCNSTYGSNGWLGLAQIWLSGSHILKGTAKVNDTYFNLSYYNVGARKLHVMCQEVAHTFGLGHQSTSSTSYNSCMDYYANLVDTDRKSTVPNTHDFGQLTSIYNHGHTSTTIASTTAVAPDRLDNPLEWGRLVSQSANGRSSYYERLYAGGIRIATHVTWTEEAAARCPQCDHRFESRE